MAVTLTPLSNLNLKNIFLAIMVHSPFCFPHSQSFLVLQISPWHFPTPFPSLAFESVNKIVHSLILQSYIFIYNFENIIPFTIIIIIIIFINNNNNANMIEIN